MENKIITIHNMNEIEDYVIKLDPSKTIIFYDIDNTLIRTKTDIGSVEWIKWQEKLFHEHGGNHKHSICKSLYELYEKYRKWLSVAKCETELLETYVPDLINKYINLGIKISLITAREKKSAKITLDQLSRHYDINKFYATHLKYEDEKNLYENGVYYSSNVNKWNCIEILLNLFKDQEDYEPVNIIFIDDTLKVCNEVATKSIANTLNKNIFIFNYLNCIEFQKIFNSIDGDILHQKWVQFENSLTY